MMQFNSQLFSQDFLLNISNQKIVLPFYHAVCNEHIPHISNLYQVRSVALFIKDLEFICKHFKPISLAELNAIVKNKVKLTNPVFHLSFDDGLKEIFTEIAPVLERKGVPATFFLNSAFIDNKDLFFRYKVSLIIEAVKNTKQAINFGTLSIIFEKQITTKTQLIQVLLGLNYNQIDKIGPIAAIFEVDFKAYLLERQPYLSSSEINILLRKGFTIGAHSIDHPHFKMLTLAEQKNQILVSSSFLEQNFEIIDKYFSFPFDDDEVSNQLFAWLFDDRKFDLTFGISGLKKDSFHTHLHRIPMEKRLNSASKIIKSEYLYFLLKQLFNKNQIIRND
ncbi:MAG: polysaccharide deacetylase family protein [Cytophagales bacterium]